MKASERWRILGERGKCRSTEVGLKRTGWFTSEALRIVPIIAVWVWLAVVLVPAPSARSAELGQPGTIQWTAHWVWPSPRAIAPHPNQSMLFRKSFTLPRSPREAQLALFADSRYRLYVNGALIGQGPARSPIYWGYYDVFDVASTLRVGLNVIAVEVNWYGRSLGWYSTQPGAWPHGALLCQLEARDGATQQIIETDPSWRACEDYAWEWDTPSMNEALASVEVYHADRVVEGWNQPDFDDSHWIHVSILRNDLGLSKPPVEPYIHFVPRPMRYPLMEEISPSRIVEVGLIRPTGAGTAALPQEITPISRLGREMAREPHEHQASVLENAASLTNASPSAFALVKPTGSAATPFFILDMGKEVDGYLELSLDASQEAVVNIGWGEMLVNGNVEANEPGGNYVARYYARPGIQHWTLREWHGLRFVELSFPNLAAPLKIRLNLLFSTAKLDHAGSFECSSALLTSLWHMGAYTWQLCTLDGTMDCPTRERRQWVGDGELELAVNSVADGTLDIARKFLWDASQEQRNDGAVPNFTDGAIEGIHASYILSYVNAVEAYYLQTADRDFVLRLYPSVVRAMGWFQDLRQPDGLLGAMPYWTFLDWSNTYLGRQGESSILNALYAHTLDNAAELAHLAADYFHARIFRDDSQRVHSIFNQRFWDPARGLYVDAWEGGHQKADLTQLANADAILYGFAPAESIPSILAKITEDSRIYRGFNITEAPNPSRDILQPETYGMFFVLNMLATHERADLVRRYIEQLWGPMVALGNGTFWEQFEPQGGGTLCHAWSGAPTYFLTTLILGVRPTRPGYSEYLLAPNPVGLEWAKGTVPTVHGAIVVDWKWTNGTQTDPASRNDARFILHLRNPASETAHIILPKHKGQGPASVTLNGKPVSEPIAVKSGGNYTVEGNY